jgi:2-amino-4-hydroxy-6-hydroxymethyldihydropteridine diphosphokinase
MPEAAPFRLHTIKSRNLLRATNHFPITFLAPTHSTGFAVTAYILIAASLMETAYIALGANIPSPAGAPRQTLDAALLRLAELGRVTARSDYYATAPVGYSDQPEFLNAAAAIETDLDPETLLERLLEIERSLGRDRSHGIANGPRTLDLDLLLYGDHILNTATLQLPHPRMIERSFVLIPLAEIAPDRIHPQARRTMKQLLLDLNDSLEKTTENASR